ncbi:MAG: DUF551 domain-containing protein [Methylocella sp.]
MRKWRTIETAPMDGTSILVFSPVDYAVLEASPQIGVWIGRWVTAWDHTVITAPTHWMPIPEPPSAKP